MEYTPQSKKTLTSSNEALFKKKSVMLPKDNRALQRDKFKMELKNRLIKS